jgi:hypothetical protein
MRKGAMLGAMTGAMIGGGALAAALVLGALELGGRAQAVMPLIADGQDGARLADYRQEGARRVDPDAVARALGLSESAYAEAGWDADSGAVVLTGLNVQLGGAQLTADRVELYGASPQDIERARSATALTPIGERLRAYGLTLATLDEGEVFTLSMREAELQGPETSRLPALVAELEEGEGNRSAFRLLSALAFDQAVLLGLSGERAEPGEGFSVDRAAVAGWRLGTLGRTSLYGLVAETGEAANREALLAAAPGVGALLDGPLGRLLFPKTDGVAIARLTLDGADLAALWPSLATGAPLPPAIPGMARIGRIEAQDVRTLLGERVVGETERVSVEEVPFYGVMPTRIELRTEGTVEDLTAGLTGTEDEGGTDLLAAMQKRGLDEVRSQLRFSYAYEPEAGTVQVAGRSALEELLDSSLRMTLSDLPYDAIVGGAEARPRLDSFILVLDDESLLEAGFEVAGVAGKRDPRVLRQQAVGLVTLAALQGGQVSPRLPDYAAAVAAFLGEGGTLRIEARPEGGFALAEARAAEPAGLLNALDLKVTRTE